MPQCSIFTAATRQQCTRQATPNQEGIPEHIPCCRSHGGVFRRTLLRQGGQPPAPGQCIVFHRTPLGGTWCDDPRAEGHVYCAHHLAQFRLRRVRHEEREAAIREQMILRQLVLDGLLERNPRPTWQAAAAELVANPDLDRADKYQIAFSYYVHVEDLPVIAVFRAEWNRLENAARPPPPPRIIRPATLGDLARDGQNVHTRFVTEQTRALEEKLLSVVVPLNQQTEITISQEWIRLLCREHPWGRILKTLNDVHRWFSQADCRMAGDNLYRRMLRGVVAKIRETDAEMRDELYRRLWEECYEATGMCCEGHLSRLCNVFVGFDEAFRTPISLGELLQTKMAAIAMSDLSVDEKQRQAIAFFNEIDLPEAERGAWLDAF